MKALVTGGGGFLGRYIVEQLLEQGHEVRVFCRGEYPELTKIGAELFRADLQNSEKVFEACQSIDIVFHVAAKAGFWGKWEEYYNANVIGTQNIIDACLKTGIKKLVFTSSPSVIFNNSAQENVNESIPYPNKYENFYSHTKAIAEQLVQSANSEQLATCSLRPHLIFGPRDNHLFPRVLAKAKQGKLPQIGTGQNLVDLTYVEDAAWAHLLAAEKLEIGSKISGKAYFISQNEPVNVWDFINQLLNSLDIPPIRIKFPLWLARIAGGLMELSYKILPLNGEPPFTRFLASELAMSHYYDISNAKNDFGYTPKYTMEEALEKTLLYYK